MPYLSTYVGLADHSEATLAYSFRAVAQGHARVADVFHTCLMLADWSDEHRRKLQPAVERYGEDQDLDEPERLHTAGLAETREGEVGLLRDLQDLHVLANLVHTTWTVIAQGAQGLRDKELLQIAESCNAETSRQLSWLNTRMKVAAPQALIVAP
jgi:hypothetical protein